MNISEQEYMAEALRYRELLVSISREGVARSAPPISQYPTIPLIRVLDATPVIAPMVTEHCAGSMISVRARCIEHCLM